MLTNFSDQSCANEVVDVRMPRVEAQRQFSGVQKEEESELEKEKSAIDRRMLQGKKEKGEEGSDKYRDSFHWSSEKHLSSDFLVEVAAKAPRLVMKAIADSKNLLKDQVFVMDPMGLVSNPEHGFKRRDAFKRAIDESMTLEDKSTKERLCSTYFGSGPSEKIDVQITPTISPVDSLEDNNGVHFRITFNPLTQNYSIFDYGIGLGSFSLVSKPFRIEEQELVSLGSSGYIMVMTEPGTQRLYIECFEASNRVQEEMGASPKTRRFDFSPEELSTIRVGRGDSCEVQILHDEKISKFHCVFFYKNGGWFLADGKDFVKPSANGTWRYLIEETPIADGMILKAQGVLFVCSLIQPEQTQ